MIRLNVLVLALVLSAPAFYQVLVTEEKTFDSALITFLIAVPVAWLMLAGLRFITAGYGTPPPTRPPVVPARRHDDEMMDLQEEEQQYAEPQM